MWRFGVALFCYVCACGAVVMPGEQDMDFGETHEDFNSVFQTCLRGEPGKEWSGADGGGVIGCASRGAVAGLMDADAQDAFTLADDVQLVRDPAVDAHAPRGTLLPIDRDPTDIRSVLDVTNAFLSRRALRWDLGRLYPGLVMRVGPTFTGVGVLDFVLDRPKHYFDDRQLSTGRLMLRRLILPLLLGLKIKLVTLVPLFFLAVVLIAKKALFFSKLALFVSGFLGLNSLFLLQNRPGSSSSSSGISSGGISVIQHDPVEDDVPPSTWFDPLSVYKGHVFRGVNYQYHEEEPREEKRKNGHTERGGRNFAWENEKMKRQ